MKNNHEKELHEEKETFFKERYSVVFAGGLFIIFFAFVIGFFCGHRYAVARFMSKIDEEAFSDKILYSLYNINGLEHDDSTDESLEESTDNKDSIAIEVIQEVVETDELVNDDNDESDKIETEVSPVESDIQNSESEKTTSSVYAAPLIGFGTRHAAENFVERLHKHDISVLVKSRVSSTVRGKKIEWYQVVTPEFSCKKDLEKMIKMIQKYEKLDNVTIVEKRKVQTNVDK